MPSTNIAYIKASCVGLNNVGQVNIPEFINQRQTGHPDSIQVLNAGYEHTCSILGNGRIHCWGCNLNGQTDVPLRHLSAMNALHVVAGGNFACAVGKDTLQVICWGNNEVSQSEEPESLTNSETTALSVG